MEVKNTSTKRTLTAIAMIIAKSSLHYNKNGQAQVKIKVVLGQKSALITDNNPFSATEIINATATNLNAFYISKKINPADEVNLTARFLCGQKKPTLKITDIKIL